VRAASWHRPKARKRIRRGSKRSVKKAPPAPAEASQGGAAAAEVGEGPKKKAPAKKAPAVKKAPPAKPEAEGGAAEGGPGPEEPQAG